MSLWWSAALIAAGATVGVGLAGSALGAWREERAGQVYELTPRYLRVALRAGAAVLALGAALFGGVSAASGDGRPAVALAADRSSAHATRPSASASVATRQNSADGDQAHATAVALTSVGQPFGGRLLQGTLPGVPGQVRIWLPPQYAPHAGGAGTSNGGGSSSGSSADAANTSASALQAVVVRAPAGELAEVWEGLAAAVQAGHANPLVAVAPADPCALAADDSALRHAVAAQFRIASRPRSWTELGVDAGSSCAAAAELAHPDLYAGAAVLGGDALPHPTAGTVPSGVRLLLAQARRDTYGQAAAGRLRAALQGAPDAGLRLSAVVRDLTPDRERFRLVRMAAVYLTEELTAALHR